MHAYIHAYTPSQWAVCSYILAYPRTNMTYIHTYMHTYMHTCIHTESVSCVLLYSNISSSHHDMHTYIHMHIHIYIYTYKCIHTYTHACMHTESVSCVLLYSNISSSQDTQNSHAEGLLPQIASACMHVICVYMYMYE